MYYGIPVEPLVPLFINSCQVCGLDMPHDEPKVSFWDARAYVCNGRI